MPLHAFNVKVGDQVFIGDADEEVGAVREVARDHLIVYIENAGDFRIDGALVVSAHDGKLVLDPTKLDKRLHQAIAKAHAKETD